MEERSMKTNGSTHRGFLAVGSALLALSMAVSTTAVAQGNKEGLDIKIRAQNRAVDDTPFCGVGEGSKGDRLTVKVSTDETGAASGTAKFTAADGTVTTMNIDQVFSFFGGLAMLDSATRNTVAIWFGDIEEDGGTAAPAHVNVEFPRGCANTVSTFTVTVDKVTTQIKFQ
jgi:hypothetical protein